MVNLEFANYFRQSLENPFVLDLSNASLMELINACIKVKENVSPTYRQHLSCLINNLRLLEGVYRVKIMPVQVTDIFWAMFIGFLQERGLAQTTIATLSNQLRSVLRWGSRYNVKISPSFDAVKIPAAKAPKIALTADDVSHIYHFDVDLFYAKRRSHFRENMKRVRDMFVLSCNLYQRHSDMVRIEPTCFERNTFTIIQRKTGSRAKVDITRDVIDPKVTLAILERYKYEAPYKGDINNYNNRLRRLMKDVGLVEPVRFEEKVHGEMQVDIRPRYELITSHTARRTAVTLAFLRGMNMHNIRKCSGHQSLDMVEAYIKDE